MKRTSAELKQIARGNLVGHYGVPIAATVILYLIIMAASMPFGIFLNLNYTQTNLLLYQIATMIISLVSIVFSVGLLRIHLRLARGETPDLQDLFYGLTRRPDRFLLGGLIFLAIMFLCILPGTIVLIAALVRFSVSLIIFALFLLLCGAVCILLVELQFSLVYILLIDHPHMGVIEAFRTSSRKMRGNKGRYFYIQLSFIGLGLVCVLSCGIGMLWFFPYMNQTNIEFYRDVMGELDGNSQASEKEPIFDKTDFQTF